MKTIDIALMRQRGMSIAEIAKKSGIPSKEVSNRLKEYARQSRDYSCAVFARSRAGNRYTGKHPEQKGGNT